MTHRFEVPSAQVKSAVLLAGLHAEGFTSVIEPAQTRDHTERALVTFGVVVGTEGDAVSVAGHQRLTAQSLSVPGDFSSAAFWMVAAAALPGSRVEIEDVGLNPTRTALIGAATVRSTGARRDHRNGGGRAARHRPRRKRSHRLDRDFARRGAGAHR
jgi:5-enolpyruvylshikimate-3-phosphate synthase